MRRNKEQNTAVKRRIAIQSQRTERLLAVHSVVSTTLRTAVNAPSPERAAKIQKRQAMKARPPGYKANRPWWEEAEPTLDLAHPSNHVPPPVLTPEAERTDTRCVTLTTRELHILLRAAQPPARIERTRRAHVRMRDAIESFTDELAALDSNRIPDSLIAAAQVLATTTDAWLAQATRANEAEHQARNRWVARCTITAIKRSPDAAVPDLFTPKAQPSQPVARKRHHAAG